VEVLIDMNESIVASISCDVDIEFLDKRTSQLKSQKSRKNAIVRIRKINGGFEIVIKTANNNDFFITEKPIIFQKLKVNGKITLKIPEQTCSLLIHDTTEESIDTLLEVFSSTTPVQTQKISSNAIHTPESKKLARQKPPLESPPSCSLYPHHKLKSPIKRRIIIGTGTPSKNINSNSPQNYR
jgi:hypothetical protein